MSEVIVRPRADRTRFSLHEEEEVVEVTPHRRQIVYFETNLQAEIADRFVGANLGVYWVPGQFETPWAGPDVLVSRNLPASARPRVYLLWEDGPIQFVAEVASDRTRRSERKKREEIYRTALQVPEYLYVDLDRHELELWRLEAGEYQRVPEEGGRLLSQELGLWFGWGPGEEFVRIWTPDGRMLPTKEEEREQRQQAEEQARQERQHRLTADRRARQERERRQEAEARAAALEAELERLRHATRPPDSEP
jgi:Uma2 family endonuclease